MEQNWITKTIDKIVEERRSFFWERSALDEFLVANPQWHFHRYKDVHCSGVSFVVEHADLVRVR